MNNEEALLKAYKLGCELAYSSDREKTAFIAPVVNAAKFMFMGGNLGRAGSVASKISPHWVGAPLGFGAMEAAMAEEGDKVNAFGRGMVSGLLFNPLMSIGGKIGGRLLAPGLKGMGTGSSAAKFMRRVGFSPEAARHMQLSRGLNKQLHSGMLKNTQRALQSGNYTGGNIKKYLGKIDSKMVPEALRGDLLKLQNQFSGRVAASQQSAALQDLQNFSKKLYDVGYGSGGKAAQRALKATRVAKGVGMAVGGMGLGMMGSHPITASMDNSQASYFNEYGGH